jgi:hypothetical protein
MIRTLTPRGPKWLESRPFEGLGDKGFRKHVRRVPTWWRVNDGKQSGASPAATFVTRAMRPASSVLRQTRDRRS